MLRNKGIYLLAVAVVAAFGFIGQAMSQESRPAGAPGGRGGPGGRGNFDPAAFRAEMEKRMKESLGVTDDEWKVLQPKIEKVQTLQRESRGGMGGGRTGRGNRGGNQPADAGAAPAAQSDVQKAMAELTKLLENKDSKAEDVKAALAALRDARAKADADLEKAQKDLKDVLTVKQEAQLVADGVLK